MIKGTSKRGWWSHRLKNAHQLLCDSVADSLAKRGFNVTIEKYVSFPEEKPRDAPKYWRPKYCFVDVYGERDDEVIIYECGSCSQEKIDWLRKRFNRVIYMPYLDQWCPKQYEPYYESLMSRFKPCTPQELIDKMLEGE